MKHSLSYKNEDDKCYGATGMAVGMVVLDGEKMLAAVSLDAEPGDIIEYTDEFFFSGNPGLSAKTAWAHIVNNYNLSVGLLIANVMCRSLVLNSEPVTPDIKEHLRHQAVDEGTEWCSLEEDEINRLFDKNYSYMMRVFNHRGVQSIVHDFARTLKDHRRMTRFEVLEQLRALTML